MKNYRKKKIHEFSQNMITGLNQLRNFYPNDQLFDKLLAETYYEIEERELALFYCEKVLIVDSEDKKIVELKKKLC